MIKQSSAVLALFLGTTDARMKMRAPKSINLFATGMAGDEDLGQDIIMKGDKYHYQQLGQVEIQETNAPRNTQPVRARDDAKAAEEPKKDEKKDEKKEKKAEKKDAKAGDKKDEKKADAKDEKKADAKDEKADAKDAKEEKKDAKEGEGEEKKDEKKDEEEKKDQKPGEATWEDHNDCKGNEWEAPDGNCAFEAEAVKIASHDHHQYGNGDASLVQVDYPQQFSQGPGQPAKGWWNDPLENKHADALSQTGYNKWVRHFVKENVTSTPNSGRPEQMALPESQITYPTRYIAEAAKPTGTKMSLAQWSQHDFNGNPERVQIIDPVTYQDRANSGSYLGNKRTTFYAQGDDQPAGTNQGSNQLINTAKNLDWEEGQYRAKFSPPSNVALPKGIYKNVIQEGQKAKTQADARKAVEQVQEKVVAKPAKLEKPEKQDKEPSFAKEAKKELDKVLENVEEGAAKEELKEAKKDIKQAAEDIKEAAADEAAASEDDAASAASGSESGSESEEEEVQVRSNKYDTCANGSCQTPQWPGEVLPASEPVLRQPSSPVDDGYEPTLNAVFDNRWN